MAHNWAERGLGAPPIRLASHIHTRSMSLPEYVPTDTPTLSIDDQHSLLDDDESQLITPPVSGQLLVAPMGALHLGLPRKSRSMRSRRSVASVTSSDADAAGLTPKRQRTREYVPRPPGDVVQICLEEDVLHLSAEATDFQSTQLHLIEAGADIPTGIKNANLTRHWDLKFGRALGRGRLGSAYRATLTPRHTTTALTTSLGPRGSGAPAESDVVHLVAKLMVLSPNAHLRNGKPRSDAYADENSALDAAWDEAEIYGRLAPVQGDIVPYYYGLLSTRQDGHTHVIALMSDAGDALEDTPDSKATYMRLEKNIKAVYRRLHAEFLILHVDIGARHIRLAPGGEDKIFLIDFEASMARGDCVEEAGDDEEWDKAVSKEANEVVSVITQGIKKNRKAA